MKILRIMFSLLALTGIACAQNSGAASYSSGVSSSQINNGTLPASFSSLAVGTTVTALDYYTNNLPNDGSTATVVNNAVCENSSGNVQQCGANTKAHVIGACVSGCGTTGSPVVAVRGSVASLVFDATSAVTAGHWVVASATAGQVADTGSATYPTCGNQVVGVATTGGLASTTQSVRIQPDPLPACGTAGQVMMAPGTTSLALQSITGDASLSGAGALTVSKIGGNSIATPVGCPASSYQYPCLVANPAALTGLTANLPNSTALSVVPANGAGDYSSPIQGPRAGSGIVQSLRVRQDAKGLMNRPGVSKTLTA